jgi:dihydrolipoamide dehydrogenase
MAEKYDVIVIGAGPAGYPAAFRCAQLGLKTACVDDFTNPDGKPSPGGTCLNTGCIPSKALLDSSKHYEQVLHHYGDHGIKIKGADIDVAKMLERKNQIVKQLTGGVQQLMKANKVDFVAGHGKLLEGNKVEVSPTGKGKKQTLEGKHVILAAGSVPIELKGVPYDEEYIVANAGALDFKDVPKKLGVIGAGVIGLELGSVWSRLGSDVVLLEALDDFLAAADRDIARAAQKEFKNQKLDIRMGAKVNKAEVTKGKVKVSYTDKDGDHQLTVDRLLCAVGRRANTDDLLGDKTGVKLDDRGRIEVDDDCRTAADNVWAVGDAVRGPMLAHKGTEEGIAVAERIAGKSAHVDLNTVPWVIYTEPEIAWVGKTEQELKDEGVAYRSGKFPFAANGRAIAMSETAGLVKILADEKHDRILGVHIVGANASELISEAVVAMEFGGSAEDIATIVHAHPTLTEATHEAAQALHKRAIHRAN